MISGAAQADVGILCIEADETAFESGFGRNGQTKEHALLASSLGLTELIVAVNKMDVVNWRQEDYLKSEKSMSAFLKTVGYNKKNTRFVPVSGLMGDNVKDKPKRMSWYKGACAVHSRR